MISPNLSVWPLQIPKKRIFKFMDRVSYFLAFFRFFCNCFVGIDLPSCSGGDQLRLICMGKGMLMPDSRTLEDCQVPVFKTHPTPINVSVRPAASEPGASKSAGESKAARGGTATAGAGSAAARPPPSGAAVADQGCACIIL